MIASASLEQYNFIDMGGSGVNPLRLATLKPYLNNLRKGFYCCFK
jgi:hypothetical protein